MMKPFLFGMACLGTLFLSQLGAEEEDKKTKEVTAPGFDGNILGMDVQAERLGVVLDISKGMHRSLPAIREALRKQLPRTPVLHVDGCGLEKPDPRPKVINGVAPETVTAVDLLGKHAKIDAVLWISDMGDPPNRAGVEAMAGTLAEHGIRLFLMSLRNKPGPSLRKLAEESKGIWQIVPTSDSKPR
jgi:hypothetical protein